MKVWQYLKRSPWRTLLLPIAIFGVSGLAYLLWSPGITVRDGRHDLRSNGIWLQHGWLGDDLWFKRNGKDPALFRDQNKIQGLADLLAGHGVKYVFPHVCPCNPKGNIAPVDPKQTERFLDHFGDFQVIPLASIHAGLSKYKTLPEHYAGVAIYCEWEVDQAEWNYFAVEFEKK